MFRVEAGDGRGRQSRRDEQLRRKLETEIGKRRHKAAFTKQPTAGGKKLPGSVMGLSPLPPLTMAHDTGVLTAAQYLSAHRANCALVLDNDGAVCGIFTAKDLALKVVGLSVDRFNITVSEIMTPNPRCVSTSTSAMDALNLMVARGFRHLPVMGPNGEIAGILDITKCFYEAMQKLERAFESSRRLHDALEGVKNELGASQPAKFLGYVQALHAQTQGPDLGSVLSGRPPVVVDVRSTVSEAAMQMREGQTTAVLVSNGQAVCGIFTTKDVVLRVMSAGLDPDRCSVVRVMTPEPDAAPITMSIHEALRKMHQGHYLNLPVTGVDAQIVGIVDVLRLTYATLEQINGMSDRTDQASEGAGLNKFWATLDETTSSVNESQESMDFASGFNGEVTESELAEFAIPEVPEAGENPVSDFTHSAPSDIILDDDSISTREWSQSEPRSQFVYKFRAPSGRAHRIIIHSSSTVKEFRDAVTAKLSASDLRVLGGADDFAISYVDEEGDVIAITSDEDVAEAVSSAQRAGDNKAHIYIHHAEGRAEVPGILDSSLPLIAGGIAALAIAALIWRRS